MLILPPGRLRSFGFKVLALGLGLACVSHPTFAQFGGRAVSKVYPDTSFAAEALLKNADNHARGGQYAEAIEIYQRIIQQFPDKVVEVLPTPGQEPPVNPALAAAGTAVAADDSKLFVDSRFDCQRRIAALPPEARALYRARVDAQAERWFKQGQAERDRSLLRRVLEEAFCSSWGDEALELLGDLSFQEGQFAEALSAYRQLVPDSSTEGQGLIHPDISVDLAKVAAKKLICRMAMSDNRPTAADLAAFAKTYPQAQGEIAGRNGELVKSLEQALMQDRLAIPAQPDGRWPTFAGSPTRTKVAPGSIEVGSLQWKVDLTPISPSSLPNFRRRNMGMGMPIGMPNVPPDRLLAYYPIVVGEQVIVSDEKSVTAYNLNQRPGGDAPAAAATAAIAWRHEHQGQFVSEASRPHHGLGRFTLTAHGDRIYARMGPPPPAANLNAMGMRGGMMGQTAVVNSYIIALDRAAEGKLLWKRAAAEIVLPKRKADADTRTATFEGTPVADARNVYVGVTDRAEMTTSYIACLDAESGVTRWVRYISMANPAATPFNGSSVTEISHRLLTLDGPTLYYQTNMGAVASLDVEAGAIRWMATYPTDSRAGFGQTQERDLNPAIAYNGMVIVAPEDANAMFAFDGATGKMVWKSRPFPDDVKLAHVLGVAKGKVVATGDRVLLFDVKTGALVRGWPEGGQAPQGFGRGILAGDRIYWPTKTEIHVLDQDSGLMADQPIRIQEKFQTGGGNLAVGDGFLIVSQGDALVVFCQLSRLIERYKDEIARAPEQASNYFQLAQAAEASGMDELALTSLASVLKHSRPSESIDGHPLVEMARDHQHRLYMRQGETAKKAKKWTMAIAAFAKAAEVARADRDRLAARLELADAQLNDGAAVPATSTLQSLLADERMRPLIVAVSDGRRSVRADLLIADRLGTLVKAQGRSAYAEFDKAARGLLERGVKEKDPRMLADVGRSYPAAQVVPEAYLALGSLYETLKQPQDATRAYRRLLATEATDPVKARAFLGLAKAYESQRLWQPAREAYLQALGRLKASKDDDTSIESLAKSVVARLAREPFDRMTGESSEPALPLPLTRKWGRQWPATLKPLAADGIPPSGDQGRVFLVDGASLQAIDPLTGTAAWSIGLGGDPIWVGYLADRVVAATKSKIVALSLTKGAIEWQYDLAEMNPKAAANPFAPAPAAHAGNEKGAGAFSEFRIVAGRVFCLKGDQSLMAFDGDTGQVDWSYSPASGQINPKLYVGPSRIVFQVRKPNAIVVLDTASGRRRGEFPQGDDEEWPRDPLPIDDDHVALVPDRRTITLFDLNRGVNAWVFRESKELPKCGPPRLLGDAERLLVLHSGMELIRLDPATGSKRWSRPIGDEDLSERPDSFVLGGDTFYVADGADLTAIALSDGATLWRRKLIGPSFGWSVILTDRCVAAFPNPARLSEEELGGVLPLIFRRRDSGELVQRFLFPTPVSNLTVKLAPRGAIVATQAGLWALGDRRDPAFP